MPYIKLLTILAGLALLTACGGAATPKTDNTGDTGEVNTTDCTATPFDTNCDADESAIALRQTQCVEDVTTNPTCGGVIANFCTENPHRTFAGVCTGDAYLPNRIADCIEGGKADSPNCMTITTDATKNTTLTACLENPFDVACESVPDFMSSFALARTNRLTFCDNSDNATNDLCTGDNVGIICGIDLFTAICPDATYGTPRQEACLASITADPSCTGEMGIVTLFCKADPFSTETACMADTYLPDRIADCIADGNADGVNCATITADTAMNTMITDCLENPFATACESVSAFSSSFALARTNRASFCNDNMNVANALCMGASLMGICGSDPFHAICLTGGTYIVPRQTACLALITADPTCSAVLAVNHADFKAYYADSARTRERTLHATPTAVNNQGAFVEGTATSLPTEGLTFRTSSQFEPVTVKLGGVVEGESGFADIDDGFAVMFGTTVGDSPIGNQPRYRAGLLSGTDLGPAVSTTGTATWTGKFYTSFLIEGTLSSADLSLAVNFTNGTIGTTSSFTAIGNHTASVNGLFGAGLPAGTPAGILGGTVVYSASGSENALPLIGLIGTEGVIGIFHGHAAFGLAGGFYAEPPAPSNGN